MNVKTLYFNSLVGIYYDPTESTHPRNYGIVLPVNDLVRVRLAVTNGFARVDANGIPTSLTQDLSANTGATFSLKSFGNYRSKITQPANFEVDGFDLSDVGWHAPNVGRFTLAPVVVPTSAISLIPRQEFICDIALLSGVNNVNIWTLDSGYYGFVCGVISTVLLTGPSSATPGSSGSIPTPGATAVIAGINTSLVVALVGMTATGSVSLVQVGAQGDADWGGSVVPSLKFAANQFTIIVSQAPQVNPGDGKVFRFNWTLERLS